MPVTAGTSEAAAARHAREQAPVLWRGRHPACRRAKPWMDARLWNAACWC